MAWLLVNIKLKILVVDKEAAALLVDGEVSIVALGQQVHVVTMRQLGLHLNAGLPVNVWTPLRVDVAPVVLLSTLAKASLHLGSGGLQIMMYDIEILEGRKLAVRRQKGHCEKIPSYTVFRRVISDNWTYPNISACATWPANGRQYQCPVSGTPTQSCDSSWSRSWWSCRSHRSRDGQPRRRRICSPVPGPNQRPPSDRHGPAMSKQEVS